MMEWNIVNQNEIEVAMSTLSESPLHPQNSEETIKEIKVIPCFTDSKQPAYIFPQAKCVILNGHLYRLITKTKVLLRFCSEVYYLHKHEDMFSFWVSIDDCIGQGCCYIIMNYNDNGKWFCGHMLLPIGDHSSPKTKSVFDLRQKVNEWERGWILLQKLFRKRSQKRKLALCMSQHHRLGGSSPFSALPIELVQQIWLT